MVIIRNGLGYLWLEITATGMSKSQVFIIIAMPVHWCASASSTGNGHDTIPKGLPVSFYAAYPRPGGVGKPFATFVVPADRLMVCESFSYIVHTPPSRFLYACVN